ncbi:ATP-binding protein [soil metagenome]
MPRIFNSAAYRIALVYALSFALATVVLGTAVVVASHAAFMRQLEAQIVEDSGALMAEHRLEGQRGLRFAIDEREAGNTANELLYAVYARDGRRIAGGLQAHRPPRGWSELPFYDPREGPDLARAWAVDLADGSRLVVGADRSVVDRVDQTLSIIFAAAFVAILILSLAGALLLGNYLRRRLSSISMAADRIIEGDFAQRVPESGHADEFDALARALNRMLDRITTLLENLRQVSSDVAHDLRTPLARLRNHLEQSLTDTEPGSGGQREGLESALAQADGVLTLFASILRISEIEGGQQRARFSRFDLAALVREIGESYVPAIEDGGRELTLDITPHANVHGDRELLAQAVINLLDNARIHTPAGTKIALRLPSASDVVAISVDDHGPGVPAEAQGAIFRRFVRLDKGRNVRGHGLGLNLVAAIVALHDGVLDVGDNNPGLRVGFRLPAANPMPSQ